MSFCNTFTSTENVSVQSIAISSHHFIFYARSPFYFFCSAYMMEQQPSIHPSIYTHIDDDETRKRKSIARSDRKKRKKKPKEMRRKFHPYFYMFLSPLLLLLVRLLVREGGLDGFGSCLVCMKLKNTRRYRIRG